MTGGRMKFEDPKCTKGPSGKIVYVPRKEDAAKGMREEFERVSSETAWFCSLIWKLKISIVE
jgi:hypothetical protein